MNLQLKVHTADPAHMQIERQLRRQLETGELTPGERLPSSTELARQWGVSCTVVQKALGRMTAAGLLDRSRKRGTFVRAATDKAVVGLMFGPSLADETAHFYRAVVTAMRMEIKKRHWSCRVYDGLTELEAGSGPRYSPVWEHLKKDVRNYAFKGLIEFAPDQEWPKEVEAQAQLPIARYNPAFDNTDLRHDLYSFAKESTVFFARNGRKRILYLRPNWHPSKHSEDIDGLLDGVREFGLSKPMIELIQVTGEGAHIERESYRKTGQLVRDWRSGANQSDHPDALLVGDDVGMRGVALALAQAGIETPRDLLVVTFANTEIDLHYGIPVVRYEFSTRDIARHLLDLLWKRMLGQSLPPLPITLRGRLNESLNQDTSDDAAAGATDNGEE
jgi:DNA-binding transcriptional regulator YhcF (GntR family)